jgi:hypothetical protein
MLVSGDLLSAPVAEQAATQAGHLIAALVSFDGLSAGRARLGGLLD